MLFIHYFNSRISRIGPSNGAPAGIFRFGSLRKAENVLLFQEKLAWNFEIRVISSWLWSALPRRTICLSVRSSRSEGRKSGIRRQSSPFSNTGSQWIKAPLRSAFISIISVSESKRFVLFLDPLSYFSSFPKIHRCILHRKNLSCRY